MRAPRASPRIAVTTIAIVAACGRIGFEQRTDGGGSGSTDAPTFVPALVAMTGSSTGDASNFASLQITIPEVTAGNLLVVAFADHHGSTVMSVVDASNRPLRSANARAMMYIASELWYETESMPTTGITVTVTPPSDFDVWVGEFSGTSPGPPAMVAMNCLQYPPTIVTAPGVTTVANELVFSVTMLAFPLYISEVLPPFGGANAINGNSASFYVAPDPGSYSTSFGIASGSGMAASTCASTATWQPMP